MTSFARYYLLMSDPLDVLRDSRNRYANLNSENQYIFDVHQLIFPRLALLGNFRRLRKMLRL